MTRQRSNPAEPARTDDEETSIQRAFDLPTARSFTVEGDARLSARAPDAVLDALLGRPDAADGGVTATSTARLDGDLGALGVVRDRRRPDDRVADALRVRAGQRRHLHVGAARSRSTTSTSSCSRTGATRCRPSSRSPPTTASRSSCPSRRSQTMRLQRERDRVAARRSPCARSPGRRSRSSSRASDR